CRYLSQTESNSWETFDESVALPADRPDLGHDLDRHQAADGGGSCCCLHRLPLCPGLTGTVCNALAQRTPAVTGSPRPGHLPGAGGVSVLSQLSLLLYRQSVDSQWPDRR